MATPIRYAEWLAWVTKLTQECAGQRLELARSPLEGFRCFLGEQPTHLVPERLLRQLQGSSGGDGLVVNPRCHLSTDHELPHALTAATAAFKAGDLSRATVAWVEDPATESWMPFCIDAETAALVRDLRQDVEKIEELPMDVRANLCQAQILVGRDFADSRQKNWSEFARRCRAGFRESGYAPVSNLIHPFQLGELRRHFRRRIRKGAIHLGDSQSPRRYIAHNEPAARFFHLQLTKAVSDMVGEAVKPSYVYMASYLSGARLEKHTDREQCEFSITLCLDYAPEPRAATPWPLYLDTRDGTVTVYQCLGDGLLYRGRERPHYRRTLAEGNTSSSIFFHYVPADFDGPLE
jgi:hypothetical protein